MAEVLIEGFTPSELLELAQGELSAAILSGETVVFRAGSAGILGRFARVGHRLRVELAHIDGGGEGILPALWSLAHDYARIQRLGELEWIVHALNCDPPNPRLQRLLRRMGFDETTMEHTGPVLHQLRRAEKGFRVQLQTAEYMKVASRLRVRAKFERIVDEPRWERLPLDTGENIDILSQWESGKPVLLCAEGDAEVEGSLELDLDTGRWYARLDQFTFHYYLLDQFPYDPALSDLLPRILVDFNTTMTDPRCRVSIQDEDVIETNGRVMLYESDLQAEAVLVLENGRWYGLPDRFTFKDLL